MRQILIVKMKVILILGGPTLIPTTPTDGFYLPTGHVKERLDRGLQLWHELLGEDEGVIMMVSGGNGGHRVVSEATVMTKYLIDRGVPSTSIIRETLSFNTIENCIMSKIILQRMEDGGWKMIEDPSPEALKYDPSLSSILDERLETLYVVSSDYHIPRVMLIFEHYYPEVTKMFIGSKTKDYPEHIFIHEQLLVDNLSEAFQRYPLAYRLTSEAITVRTAGLAL